MKALVGAFNQEKALVGAFSVIVQSVVESMELYTALNRTVGLNADGVRVIGVNEWAKTGPKGLPQPDGFTPAGGLGEEPCMAVKDGAWHDTSCHDRRAIVCEDLPSNNIQFVRNNNPGVFIP